MLKVRWSSRGWRGVSFGEMDRGVVPGERWGEQRTCSKMSLASIVIQGRWGHRTANDEVEESSERLSRRNQGSITQFEKAQGSCQKPKLKTYHGSLNSFCRNISTKRRSLHVQLRLLQDSDFLNVAVEWRAFLRCVCFDH